MHEAGVCAEIVRSVERVAVCNGLEHVSRIDVVTGPSSCLREQDLNFYFHVMQEGTCMEGAWICVARDPAIVDEAAMFIKSIEGE